MKGNYSVVVEKVFPFGIFVKLADGRRGYIRRREMSWEGDLDPRELVRVGQEIEALPLNTDLAVETMLLSYRATLPDPWEDFISCHAVSDSITGTVKRLGPDSVWVQIRPGVYGMVPLDELSPNPIGKPEEVVWPGDDIVAVITQIFPDRRQVGLSMRRRLQQLAIVTSFMTNIAKPSKSSEKLDNLVNDKKTIAFTKALNPQEIERIGRVLVVEDQEDIRVSLVRWVKDRGLPVTGVPGKEQALKMLAQQKYGMCLIDIGLSGEDGLDLIHNIQQVSKDICVAVMSTPEWLERRSIEIATLEVAAALAKPLDLTELEGLLHSLGQGKCPCLASREHMTRSDAPVFSPTEHNKQEQGSIHERLLQTLETALLTTQAEKVILFEMEPSTKTIKILAQVGQLPLDTNALYLLSHSPVEDVISEVESVVTDQVSLETTRRFAKLQPLLPFESCFGLPVIVGSSVYHSLFFFHRKPRVFNIYRQRDGQASAILLAAYLERLDFDEHLLTIGDLLLSGRLASAFSHEIHNKMAAVELQGANIHHSLMNSSGSRPDVDKLRESLEDLIRSTQQLKETVNRFQDLMRAEEEWELDVNQVVRSVREHMRTILHEKRVVLRFNLDDKLPLVPGHPQRFHYVILNLLLNAVQHLETKNPSERHLEIYTLYEPDHGEWPIRIRINDSGPGIHKQLWEKIFQLGISTRPDGTGLGLYIARSLVNNMGGKIKVESSYIGVGTTFLIVFPEASTKGALGNGAN